MTQLYVSVQKGNNEKITLRNPAKINHGAEMGLIIGFMSVTSAVTGERITYIYRVRQ